MNRIKTQLGALAAVVSLTAAMSMSALAAEPSVSADGTGEKVYTKTVELSAVPYAVEQDKTVTSGQSLSLALAAGASGWSSPATTFRVSLPDKAKVRSVEINPGTGVSNNGNHNMLGAVTFSQLKLVSPDGITATIKWNAGGMTEKTTFVGKQAKGTWSATVYGTNMARPVSDPTENLRRFGSLIYKSPKMTIKYVEE